MSYDLKLFRDPEGIEPEAAYEELMCKEESEIGDTNRSVKPLPYSSRATMERLADAVTSCWPSFVRFQPPSPLPWIELNDEDIQIQFSVYEQTASITIPYFGEPTDQLMRCIRCCLRASREECGYIAFDPQLGRVVTVDDLDQIAQLYRGMALKAKPWWKFW